MPDISSWFVPLALLLPLFAVRRSRAAPPELKRFKITHALPTAIQAPVLLVLLLLITDPATSPRSALGKLFFGACVALGMGLARYGLDTAGVSDFYGKLVGVVVANSLTDVFDRWAAAIKQRWPAWVRPLDPRFNAIHVALTFALAASLMSGKRGVFLDPAQQESMRVEVVPGLVRGPDGTYPCEQNPAWCKPFSFLDELALDRGRPSRDDRRDLPTK